MYEQHGLHARSFLKKSRVSRDGRTRKSGLRCFSLPENNKAWSRRNTCHSRSNARIAHNMKASLIATILATSAVLSVHSRPLQETDHSTLYRLFHAPGQDLFVRGYIGHEENHNVSRAKLTLFVERNDLGIFIVSECRE